MRNFWNDETGFIVSAELILIATILVIGLIVGLTEVQAAVVSELNDVSCAIGSLNQSYVFYGFTGCKGTTTGSIYHDFPDSCDNCAVDLCASNIALPECGIIGNGAAGR
jgi:Flp pilus assembly pilin Flp